MRKQKSEPLPVFDLSGVSEAEYVHKILPPCLDVMGAK
jgi:hypothetical protein